ncbi:signal peptidase II, partial [Bacillus vallismortis]|uniref:signal peptidase II n=1 Tax=Bacillus vallismortis TaxID=72361 RepID=UPI00374DCDB8
HVAEAERIIGTPDTPETAGTEPERGGTARPRGKRRIAVLFTVPAFAYALDLNSKMIVVAKLEHHAPIRLIGDWLKLEAIRNAGAAFGFG